MHLKYFPVNCLLSEIAGNRRDHFEHNKPAQFWAASSLSFSSRPSPQQFSLTATKTDFKAKSIIDKGII